MASPCELLQSVATEYGATLCPHATGGLVDISVTRPGGAVRAFKLYVAIAGDHVSAREAPGHHLLPEFCPDRHINPNQSFCLGWGDDNPSQITDEASARKWWATVYQFLTHQASANARRVFPGAENARAHGDAAKHQAIAERAAEHLGAEFKAAASAGHFKVREDVRPSKRRLELWRGDRLIARVSLRSKTLVAGRMPCPCSSNPECEIDACGDHAEALVTFILEQHRCTVADKAYLDNCAAAGAVCCGTLEKCGLRNAIRRKHASSVKGSSQRARTSKYWLPPAKSKRPR